MVNEVRKSKVKHAMNFPTIYRPAFITLQEYLYDNVLGTPEEIELNAVFSECPRSWQKNNWISTREQGGFIKEVIPHYIQMILRLFEDIKNLESNIIYPKDLFLAETAMKAFGQANNIPLFFEAKVDENEAEDISFSIKGKTGTSLTLLRRTLWST